MTRRVEDGAETGIPAPPAGFPDDGDKTEIVTPRFLPFRPNPDSGCWEHATFVLRLMSRHRPRRCAGEGSLFAMARVLAAHHHGEIAFQPGMPEGHEPCDLLLVSAEGIGRIDPAAAAARWGIVRPDAILLVGGVDPALWHGAVDGYEATAVGAQDRLGILVPPSALADPSWAPSALRSAASACAPVNAEWLTRQRLAELTAENARLRSRLSRHAAEPPAVAPSAPVDPPSAPAMEPAHPAPPTPDDDLTLQFARAMRRSGRALPRPLRGPVRAAARGTLRLGRWCHRAARRQVWRRRARAALRDSAFFDPAWYRAQYPEIDASGTDPMRYFLQVGMWHRHEVSPRFSGSWYLAAYPDIAAGPYHPLLHYLWMGRREGRDFREAVAPAEAPAPSLLAGSPLGRAISASGYFDRDWYVARHPELEASGQDPLEHFLSTGIDRRTEASPRFDGRRYLNDHPDVDAAGVHPLVHYIEFGRAEGRAFHPHSAGAAAHRETEARARQFSLQLSPATLFRITVGLVVSPELDPERLRKAVAAASAGLESIGQNVADRILVLDLSGARSPAMLVDWPVVIVPRRGLSLSAGHNHLADIAFAQGSDIHVVLSARGVLREGALAGMITMVRAAGRQAIVGATRITPAVHAETANAAPWLASPAIAVPKAIWQAVSGLDTDYPCEGADIDFSWRVREAGFAVVQCADAGFEDAERGQSREAAQLAGAWTLGRKWGAAALEQAAAQRLGALGLSTPILSRRPPPHVTPPTVPSPEALLAPW